MYQNIYIKAHRINKALKVISDNGIKHKILEEGDVYKINVRGPHNKVIKLFELTI
jgi:hypothetical protein